MNKLRIAAGVIGILVIIGIASIIFMSIPNEAEIKNESALDKLNKAIDSIEKLQKRVDRLEKITEESAKFDVNLIREKLHFVDSRINVLDNSGFKENDAASRSAKHENKSSKELEAERIGPESTIEMAETGLIRMFVSQSGELYYDHLKTVSERLNLTKIEESLMECALEDLAYDYKKRLDRELTDGDITKNELKSLEFEYRHRIYGILESKYWEFEKMILGH